MVECVFCGIVAGSVSAFRITDEPDGLAFLDTRPVFPGHVLVIPRPHVLDLPGLPAHLLGGFFALVQRVAAAVPAALGAGGTFVAMNNTVSQSVPHLHAHVVPRTKGDGLRGFFWPRQGYLDAAQAESFAGRIAAQLVRASSGREVGEN